MARETRRQRRDARRAADEQGGNVPRPPRRSAADTAATDGDGGGSGGSWGGGVSGSGAVAAPPLAHRAGRGRFSFVRESIGELRKVEWPRRPQVVQGTIVVIIACAIVGAFLYAADQALRPFVQHVLLGQ